jgi:hypothetical protein
MKEWRRIHQGIKNVLKTDLNTKNKITSAGVLAIPILPCGFSIINWRSEEMKNWQEDQKGANNV